MPAQDFVASRSRKRQLLDELRAGWRTGHPPQPEALLARWPADPATDPDVASLLFEDYFQRREHGEGSSPEEYSRRFPIHENSVARLWDHQAFLRSLGGDSAAIGLSLALPAVGDEVFGFRLLRELGRGSFARVFCARQAALAGRPVVVKVSAIDGNEPQTLAQLQHTNIVPIHSVHEDEQAGLRVVCMPYFGGASLSRVLEHFTAADELPLEGSDLVKALVQCESQAPSGDAERTQDDQLKPRVARDTGLLAYLSSISYVRAAVWIVTRLAEALQHAHERGVLHRDLKPSNVLLAADGQPMLLDFNLAQSLEESQPKLAATLAAPLPTWRRSTYEPWRAAIRHWSARSINARISMVWEWSSMRF